MAATPVHAASCTSPGEAGGRDLLMGVAPVLLGLAVELEGLGHSLCVDPDVARRHGADLQRIDPVAQKLRCLADLLAATDIAAALQAVPLEELKLELARAEPPAVGPN